MRPFNVCLLFLDYSLNSFWICPLCHEWHIPHFIFNGQLIARNIFTASHWCSRRLIFTSEILTNMLTAVNTDLQMSPHYIDFIVFIYTDSSMVVGLCGSSIFSFFFLLNLYIVFHSCSNLHCHQKCVRGPAFPFILLPTFVLLVTGTITKARWCLVVWCGFFRRLALLIVLLTDALAISMSGFTNVCLFVYFVSLYNQVLGGGGGGYFAPQLLGFHVYFRC